MTSIVVVAIGSVRPGLSGLYGADTPLRAVPVAGPDSGARRLQTKKRTLPSIEAQLVL